MSKTPVIIDMNLTEDFALALFPLAKSRKVDILGITLSFGETSQDIAKKNIAGLLDLLGLSVPVALGANKPWRRDYTLPLRDMPISYEINGLLLDDEAEAQIAPAFAPDFLYETMKAQKAKVTLLCAGPLTNIAYLLERHPDAKGYIEKIVWRGGTQRHAVLDIVKDKQTYMDPEAAAFVLQSKIPFFMCPIDMGFCVYATKEEIDSRMESRDPIEKQYNRLLKKRWCEANQEAPMGQRNKPLPLSELAAAWYLMKPELYSTRMVYGEVDMKGDLTFGMLVIDISNRLETKPEDMNICLLCDAKREELMKNLYEES